MSNSMFNTLKQKISNNCYAANVAIISLVIIGGGLAWHTLAQASISGFTIVPTVLGTDDVVGAVDADYTISYDTDSTGTVSIIGLDFPAGYSIATVLGGSGNIESCNGTPNKICFNGVDATVTTFTSGSLAITLNLGASFDYSTLAGPDTVSFKIINTITNPTLAGVKAASGFTIDDNASGNDPVSPSGDVTIIPGPAYTLDFTTLPSMTVPPPAGDVTSGVQWDVQPIVTAHDLYGNVATGYSGDVMLSLGSGDGIFVPATSFSFCSGPANTYVTAAVNGVVDFTPASANYIATVDHEQFTLLATHLCGSGGDDIGAPGESALFTADVVADSFAWTQDPAGCTSGTACMTQGVIEARDIATVKFIDYTTIDLDFAEEVTLGTNGAGTLVGEVLQSAWVSGVLTTIGLGYTLAEPAVAEEVFFFVETPQITQQLTGGVMVAVAPVTPPTPSNPSGAGVYNPNPDEIPGQGIAITPTTPLGGTSSSFGSGASPDGGCVSYLTAYMRFGDRGDQVVRLQTFLAREGSYLEGFITGFFGTFTEKAVNIFQTKYAADILAPQNLPGPTGFAKDYTTSTINKLICSGEVKI